MHSDETFNRDRIIEFLKNPDSYPHKPKSVSHIQTHASDVFIAPPFVYKVKKPIDLGFLDFSTLEKRKYYCLREVELNSRLSDIYLGTEEISLKGEGLVIGKGTKTLEYAVKMRLVAEKYFLNNLLNAGEAGRDDLIRVLDKLVRFYESQEPSDEIIEFGRPDVVRVNIEENFRQSKRFIGKTITPRAHGAITLYNGMFFDLNRELFNDRVSKGMIKDCHGDLHLEHINLTPDSINIYDCIEFNDRFRYIDVASDIAFLAMDLDYNGQRGLSSFVVSEFARRMNDETVPEIIDFYKCYRAFVRGKVESIRCFEKEVPEDEKALSAQRAKSYFTLSLIYSLFGSRRACIVVLGLIGAGKTTLARALAGELGATVISSDIVRKKLRGASPCERKYEEYSGGIYSPEMTDKTYREMTRLAAGAIEAEGFAVVDASFSKRRYRELLVDRIKNLGAEIHFIEAMADTETIKERLLEREQAGTSISDGRWEIFHKFKDEFEPPDEIPDRFRYRADSRRPQDSVIEQIFSEIIKRRFD